VVVTFLGFIIAAEIDPDEPPAIAACDDLANFASHRDFLLACKRDTHLAHTDLEAGIDQLIEEKTANRPSAGLAGSQ